MLVNNWPTKKLGEVLERSGVIPAKIKRDEYQGSGKYPVVDQGANLIAGYIDDEKKLYQGDLPVVVFGDHTRIIKYIDFPFAVGADGTKILRPRETLLPKFFYYALLLKPVQNLGYKRHFSILRQKKISLPPLQIQKQIIEWMEKIVEVQKLNDELIQKSDELFQSLLHKELNPVGKKWELKKLDEIVDINYGKGLEKTFKKEDGKYHAYGSNGPIYRTDKTLIDESTIIIGRKGGAGLLWMTEEPSWPIDTTFYLRIKDKHNTDLNFLYFSLQTKKLPKLAIVTAVPGINRNTLYNVKISLPSLKTQKQIVAKLSAAQKYKKQLLEQKLKLKELFDSVLHKSMNGGVGN